MCSVTTNFSSPAQHSCSVTDILRCQLVGLENRKLPSKKLITQHVLSKLSQIVSWSEIHVVGHLDLVYILLIATGHAVNALWLRLTFSVRVGACRAIYNTMMFLCRVFPICSFILSIQRFQSKPTTTTSLRSRWTWTLSRWATVFGSCIGNCVLFGIVVGVDGKWRRQVVSR